MQEFVVLDRDRSGLRRHVAHDPVRRRNDLGVGEVEFGCRQCGLCGDNGGIFVAGGPEGGCGLGDRGPCRADRGLRLGEGGALGVALGLRYIEVGGELRGAAPFRLGIHQGSLLGIEVRLRFLDSILKRGDGLPRQRDLRLGIPNGGLERCGVNFDENFTLRTGSNDFTWTAETVPLTAGAM